MTVRKPLKVALVSRLFTPEVGAAAFRLQALADGLAAAGAEVAVITTRPPMAAGPAPVREYKISRWPVLRDSGGNVRGYVQYMSFDVPALFRLLFTKADVVVAEPPPTTGVVVALSSALRRRPFVYYAADIWTEALSATNVPPLVVRVMRAAEGFALRRAAKVIAVSESVAGKVVEFGVPADRVHVVGNGIDTTVFGPAGETAENTGPYFVYTGTMSEWQGADVFVRALPAVLAKFPEASIRFYGQGSDEQHLRELAAEIAPGSVYFGGVIPPAETASWIRGASAALVSIKPGQGYDFAKPTKIYAAAGCGTPVVFAGTGDAAALVADNGLGEAAQYDVASVAEAMVRILGAGDGVKEDGGRAARAAWVQEHASLAKSGKLAATEVVAAATG
ncbi:glycosyltransferase family 4 protein [Pseudarthrobacter sulfonivorans]|uniref:glycosyltransferase family 4 protein n=1 Tax=Pseudarthrobacter sulfonivorans TaxID=121292 RepID=UPI002855C872|nr:glycosyltransferase family 4 protein [Pseudarthrobacter sulfonivorans]MDR6413834.1 glycosyltransferase involved in cell wall biosynthesis [Pseudarthrobacter sulfonivorans]